MPTMVKNNQAGPTTFTDDSTGQKPVVWQGAGDRNRQDVRPIPDVFLESVAFQQALENGILSVVQSDAERAAAQAAHRRQFQEAQERQQNAGLNMIDESPNNDIVITSCLGPAGKSGNLCDEQVALTAEQRGTVPPLCNRHAYLKGKFVPTETGKVVDGKAEVTWSRPQLGQQLDS